MKLLIGLLVMDNNNGNHGHGKTDEYTAEWRQCNLVEEDNKDEESNNSDTFKNKWCKVFLRCNVYFL